MVNDIRAKAVDFLMEQENLPTVLEILEYEEAIKSRLRRDFWGALLEHMKQKLKGEASGWGVLANEPNAPNCPIILLRFQQNPCSIGFAIGFVVEKNGDHSVFDAIYWNGDSSARDRVLTSLKANQRIVKITDHAQCAKTDGPWLKWRYILKNDAREKRFYREISDKKLPGDLCDRSWELFRELRGPIEELNREMSLENSNNADDNTTGA